MKALQTLELKLGVPEGVKLSQSAGSLLHGLLMEQIDADYADFLHRQQLRPYSQYIYYDRERAGLYWRISALNTQAVQEILLSVMELPSSIHLKQKNLDLGVLDRRIISSADYGGLAEKYFASNLDVLDVEYTFRTSCTFKTEGSYALFPKPQLLLGSLVKRWNSFAVKESLEERGLISELAQQVYVYDYNLRLRAYALEGVSIPAFRGSYTLALKNNIMINKIICMLADFAAYSGIGVKTALGMGGCRVKFIERGGVK